MRKESAERTWHAIKSGLRGRKRLLMPIVGLAMLACTSGPELSQLSYTASTINPENPHPFDYCAPINSSSSEIEKSLAGVESKWKVIKPESTQHKIDTLNITSASFVRNRIADESRLQAILVPVWYSQNESDQKMQYITDILKKAYLGVNIEFSYLNQPVELGVEAVQQRARLIDVTKGDRLSEKVKKIHPVSKLIFVINTSEYIGSCCAVVITGNNQKTGYMAVHELAHDLGLSDGHKIRYPLGDVNNEELFKKKDRRPSTVQKALDATNAPIVATGNVCKGEPVSTFYDPSENIMMDFSPIDSLLLEKLKKGGVFNPLQRAMMNFDIQQKFADAKKH